MNNPPPQTPKRTPGKRRGHATNWGVVNSTGQWAVADGVVAVFDTRAAAKKWIDDPACFGKDALAWKAITDAEWTGQA
jgi:hypothetical protein